MIRATAIVSKTVDFQLDRKYVTRGETESGFPITVKLPINEAANLGRSLMEGADLLREEKDAT